MAEQGHAAEGSRPTSSETEYEDKQLIMQDMPSTNKWRRPDIQRYAFKIFKTRIRKIEARHIFWPHASVDSDGKFTIDASLSTIPRIEGIVNFVKESLQYIDVASWSWYFTDSGELKPVSLLEANTEKLYGRTFHEMVTAGEKIDKNACIHRAKWLFKPQAMIYACQVFIGRLSVFLKMHPKDISEEGFANIFSAFAGIFGISCLGSYKKFSIKFKSPVESKPDMILAMEGLNTQFFAPVEVKVDDDLKAEVYKTESSPAKRLRQQESDDEDAAATLGEESWSTRQMTDRENTLYKKFLAQLMGEVVATADICHVPSLNRRSRIGVAVVGYKVIFVNFVCSKDDLSFHLIPGTRGAGLDVCMSEPLDLLKAEDRLMIAKLLLYISNNDY